MAIKFVNNRGEYVDKNADDAAFRVNTSDNKAEEFIENLKKNAPKEAEAITTKTQGAPKNT